MKNNSLLLLAVTTMILFASSCEKALLNNFVRGVWEVRDIYTDTSSVDQKFSLVPQCSQAVRTCSYRIDFRDETQVNAYIFNDGQIKQIKEGNWELLSKEKLYLELDSLFQGEFEISKDGLNGFILESNSNKILRRDTLMHYTKIVMERL